jgi:hypothetical protein
MKAGTLRGNLEHLRTGLGAQSISEIKCVVLDQPRLLAVRAEVQAERIKELMVSLLTCAIFPQYESSNDHL